MQTLISGNKLVKMALEAQPYRSVELLLEAQDIFRSLSAWPEYYNARRMYSELMQKIIRKPLARM